MGTFILWLSGSQKLGPLDSKMMGPWGIWAEHPQPLLYVFILILIILVICIAEPPQFMGETLGLGEVK